MRYSILFRNAALALLALLAGDARAVTMSWSPVGNPGNANDSATGNVFGGVAYNYSIGKYDVTVGQYAEFLNAVAATDTYGLYNTNMAADLNIAGISQSGVLGSYTYSVVGSANHPITYVSWAGAARFANWLENGQPTGGEGPGTTETGAYTLNGAITDSALNAVTRNAGATVFIPSESEWYKAAYYSPTLNSGAGGYYQYPFSSNAVPTSAMPGSTPNTGNFASNFSGAFAVTGSASYSHIQNYLTDVGAYTASASPYGAFDMGGNVFQWNEASFGPSRGSRGGSWGANSFDLQSEVQNNGNPTGVGSSFGFRLAETPEPSSLVLAALGFVGLAAYGVVRAFLAIRSRPV
jgi:formylglycine-generating enzyme